MTTTITTPPAEANSIIPAVYVPNIALPIVIEQESRNTVHHLLRGGVDVTFRPPRPRRGTLQLHFLDRNQANYCARAHARAGTYTLVDDVEFQWNMTYVPNGRIGIDPDKVAGWWVEIDYQELP